MCFRSAHCQQQTAGHCFIKKNPQVHWGQVEVQSVFHLLRSWSLSDVKTGHDLCSPASGSAPHTEDKAAHNCHDKEKHFGVKLRQLPVKFDRTIVDRILPVPPCFGEVTSGRMSRRSHHTRAWAELKMTNHKQIPPQFSAPACFLSAAAFLHYCHIWYLCNYQIHLPKLIIDQRLILDQEPHAVKNEMFCMFPSDFCH